MVNRKKGPTSISFAQVLTVTIATIAIFTVVDFGRKAAANHQLRREEERLQREVAIERAERERLLERKAYVQTDAYTEKWAREDGKLAKPGETVIVVIPLPAKEAPRAEPAALPPSDTGPPSPHWQQWWELLFGP